MVFDDTPQNAQDTSGGGKSYDTEAGGGVMRITGKDGSHMEFSAVSGRYSVRSTGQYHMAAGKGSTESVEGNKDDRVGGGSRHQVKDDGVSTTGGTSAASAGDQSISTSGKTRTKGTPKDQHNAVEGDTVGSSSGNSFGQSRGDSVNMTKGNSINAHEGEWGHYVISGNGSSVFEKSYKIHTGEKFKQETKGKHDVKATGDLVIESESKITFKVGGSTIVMEDGAIHIKSDAIHIEAGDTLHLKGATSVKIGGGGKIEAVSGTNLATPPWVSGGGPPEGAEEGEGANVGRD